jgi:hypothetical protein
MTTPTEVINLQDRKAKQSDTPVQSDPYNFDDAQKQAQERKLKQEQQRKRDNESVKREYQLKG